MQFFDKSEKPPCGGNNAARAAEVKKMRAKKAAKAAFVAAAVVLVGAAGPASAGGLLGWLFGESRPTVAQFVTPTCKVSVTPRDSDLNVRQFAFQMPDGIAVQAVWDLRIPIAKTEVQVLTGVLELTPGSGEIVRVELALDGQRDAFEIVDPPAVVEDREKWLRDSAALLRARYRREEGQRLSREIFPPFVSVGRYDGKPQGPVIFATPISQLEFGAHSITARVFTRGDGQQVAEAVVEFLIIPDPSGVVDLGAVPGSLAAIAAAQAPQVQAPVAAPMTPPTPPPPPHPRPLAGVGGAIDLRLLRLVREHVGFSGGDPSASCRFSTSVERFGGKRPIVIILRDPASEVRVNGDLMQKYHNFCVIWSPPSLEVAIVIDETLFWQGNAPGQGEGLWLVQP